MSTTSQPPDFLTVEEAARVLRIGRTAAYALARSWRDTEGQQGIPVVEFGRLLRVPRRALEEIAGGSITTISTRKRSSSPMGRPHLPPTRSPQHLRARTALDRTARAPPHPTSRRSHSPDSMNDATITDSNDRADALAPAVPGVIRAPVERRR
jgi:hypothetical protein